MTPLPDEVVAPLRVVDGLFQKTASSPSPEWGEKQHFVDALGLLDEQSFAAIPSLNDVQVSSTLGPSTLVRYRGMVQDVFDPEMYSLFLEECEEATGSRRVVTSKYRECVYPSPGCMLEEVGGGLSDRGVAYCVPLPGETPWVRGSDATPPQAAAAEPPRAGQGKRARDDDDVEMAAPDEVARGARPRVATPEAAGVKQSAAEAGEQGKKICNADEFGLNFPLPEEECRGRGSSTACIVKLYDGDREALKVCHIVEVVGVLCVNHELAVFGSEDATPMEEGDIFQNARQPSPSLVPRLHAVMVRHLANYHPLLPFSASWLTQERLASIYRSHFASPEVLAAARSAALERLTSALGGDTLAAQYMLLLLVSRVFSTSGDRGLGSWSFNLTGWPDGGNVRDLMAAVAELVPRAVHLDITAETLAKQRWVPRKDFVADRLVAGQLQLAPGTLLLLDETKLSEGHLPSDAVKALNAITELVTASKLRCDFKCHDVKLPLELSRVVVSRGRSIIQDMDIMLPIRPVAVPGYAPDSRPLDASRMLLAILTSSPRPIRIPPETEQQFARDFAAARPEFQLTVEVGHTWLCLARAYALLHGEEELSVSRWSELMLLERERLQRCREQCPRAG